MKIILLLPVITMNILLVFAVFVIWNCIYCMLQKVQQFLIVKVFLSIHRVTSLSNCNILFIVYSEVEIVMFMNIVCIERMIYLLPNTKTVVNL